MTFWVAQVPHHWSPAAHTTPYPHPTKTLIHYNLILKHISGEEMQSTTIRSGTSFFFFSSLSLLRYKHRDTHTKGSVAWSAEGLWVFFNPFDVGSSSCGALYLLAGVCLLLHRLWPLGRSCILFLLQEGTLPRGGRAQALLSQWKHTCNRKKGREIFLLGCH